MVTLYQPFITLWVGKDLLLSMTMVVLFCIYFIVVEYVMLASVYKDAAGIWHQDRFRPLISGIVNLVLNLLMVKHLGLYGIIISTVLSAGLISAPWITMNVFRYIFPGKLKEYLLFAVKYALVIAGSMGLSYAASGLVSADGLGGLLLKLVSTIICSGAVVLAIVGRSPEFIKAKKEGNQKITGSYYAKQYAEAAEELAEGTVESLKEAVQETLEKAEEAAGNAAEQGAFHAPKAQGSRSPDAGFERGAGPHHPGLYL